MPRGKTFTDAFVAALKHSGKTRYGERHYDGDRLGLAINVTPSGRKSWVQVITVHGRKQYIGLGSYPVVSLARARKKARANHELVDDGGDPLAKKRGRGTIPDFETLARQHIARLASVLAPQTHQQWENSMARYVYPRIGRLRVDAITVDDVAAILDPIWTTKRVMAAKVSRRMTAVFETAVNRGHRSDNPGKKARSEMPNLGTAVRHHRALHWSAVPDAVKTVKNLERAWSGTRLAFEFLVLTATRSGETRQAVWDEIDLDNQVWTIPAERMKMRTAHRVPLAPRCLEILEEARALTHPPVLPALVGCPLVFPSMRGKAMSDNTLSKLLRDHQIPATPHGMRSSFRDWAAETTDAPHAVQEAALAHAVPSAVERAYVRTDFFDRRRELMQRWAEFATTGDQ